LSWTNGTVNAPSDLSNIGAPASFDTTSQFFGVQPYTVATAAPGDACLRVRRPRGGDGHGTDPRIPQIDGSK
jgi:hypothetical protein